jgi:FAD-dependent urate hydroxylase
MSRAVIIGAGPAGLVAALAARKAGLEPTVYEAYEQSAGLEQGVFLTLAVNGMDALRAADALEPVASLGFPTGRIRFLNGGGKDLGSMPIGPRLADGTVTRTVLRADLYKALYALALDRDVPIHHGKRVTGVLTGDAGQVPVAQFDDATSAGADVLIGADGLRSAVRRAIDPDAHSPTYTGMGNVGALVRTDAVDVTAEAADGDYRMIWGRRCFFGYTVSPDGEIWWFANPPSKEPLPRGTGAADAAARKRALIEMLAVDQGPAAAIVEATTDPIHFGNQETLAKVPAWRRDATVVIGDAAHAVSPSTGQGVSLACEDAVQLARCLRDAPDVPAALALYEGLRRERVERVVEWGRKMGSSKTVGPVGRLLRELVLPRILAKGATPEAMEKQGWLFDHHVEWERSAMAGEARRAPRAGTAA